MAHRHFSTSLHQNQRAECIYSGVCATWYAKTISLDLLLEPPHAITAWFYHGLYGKPKCEEDFGMLMTRRIRTTQDWKNFRVIVANTCAFATMRAVYTHAEYITRAAQQPRARGIILLLLLLSNTYTYTHIIGVTASRSSNNYRSAADAALVTI